MSLYRLFAYLILSLAALIFIVLPAATITLAHSNTGSQWLVNYAKPWLPKMVSFASFEGSLAGAMRLEQLQVSTPAFSARLDYLAIDWNPWRLVEGELAISTLTLGSGEIRVRQDSTEASTDPATDIKSFAVTPLIAVSIDDLQLKKSWLFINELPQQQVAFNAALALSTQGRLSVTSFALRHQYLSVTSNVTAALSYPFDYQLSSTLTLHSPDYPKTSLQLQSAGDIVELGGDFTVTKSIDASGQFSVSDVLSSIQWDATTRIAGARINDWLTALDAPQIGTVNVSGKLNASGTEQTLVNIEPALTVTYQGTPINITGATQLNQQTLLFKSLRAHLPDTIKNKQDRTMPISGAVEISGRVDLKETPRFDVGLTVNEVTYRHTTSNGTVSLSGPLAQLSIDADTVTHLQLDEPNTIKMHANAVLQPSRLRFEKLAINEARFSGQVVGTAAVDWQNDLTISSDLSGQLFDEPFSLLANVTYNAPYLTVKQLSAQWRQSHISASGRMAPGSKLSLSAQIADLRQLPIPIEASGDINIDATVEGDVTAPWFDITIDSNRLSLADTDLTDTGVTITGDLSRHELTAHATALATQWQISSVNTVGADNINLNVSEFIADHESLEPLQLHDGPATIEFQWSDKSLSVSSLCFTQAQLTAPACIDATTNQSVTTLALSLPKTNVAVFNPFIAAASFNLEGTISAAAQAGWSWKNSSLTTVNANLSSSNLVLHGLEESVAIDQISLELTPEREHFTLTLDARATDIGLTAHGQATLQQLSLDTSLEGSIETTLNDIALLQVIVPEVSSAEGKLTANLGFSGSPQRLILRPKAHAQIEQLVLSQTGTLIKQAELHLMPTPQQSARFSLNGSGQIGDGAFSLEGTFDMASTTLDATLQGNNLHVLDTPKVSVIVSPDLNVALTQNKLSITGNVNVPSAHISPPKLSDVQRPSSDVVIKQQTQEQTDPLSTYANITLSLGDNVNVSAYGFDGQLQGTLNIIQADAGVARGNGTIGVKTGTYEIYGQELTIDRGELVYNGGPLSNPSLNLQVVRNLPDATASPERVGARVQGTLQEPTLTLFSEPPMPDSSILSYLMFGRAPNSSAESSNLELQAALLLTGDITDSFTQSLKDTFGFDEVAIDSATADVNDTSLYIGKYITPRLYIKYGIGLIESTSSFFLRYQLTEHLWIESTSSTESQGGDLIYSIEK